MTDHIAKQDEKNIPVRPLAIGETFTGEWRDLRPYVNLFLSGGSEGPVSIFIDWSDDEGADPSRKTASSTTLTDVLQGSLAAARRTPRVAA